MLDGRDVCARCSHLRAVHGAPRSNLGLGCLMDGGHPFKCSCGEFVEKSDETLPHLGEGELPSVLPGVEDSSLTLGDRVLFRTPLIRKRGRELKERPLRDYYDPEKTAGTERYYEYRHDWVRNELVQMWRQGIIIGKRTLQNGRYDFGGGDEQASLYDITYVPAYLIAHNLHQKPVRVLEDDIKRL